MAKHGWNFSRLDTSIPARRQAWLDWLAAHGVDSWDVALFPGWVEADDDARQVKYLGIARDRSGEVIVRGSEIKRSPKTVQLDRSPAPFPEFAR